jgi:hypothetical protein
LRWDNIDNRIPSNIRFRAALPLARSHILTPETMANKQVLEFNSRGAANRRKFTTYGGYLAPRDADTVSARLPEVLRSSWWFLSTALPMHLGREHAVLRSLNCQIAGAAGERPGGHGRLPYGLNDGITPLSSSLFLPSELLASGFITDTSNLATLREHIDVTRARVFRNTDHLSFIDGYRPAGSSQRFFDELAPAEGKKTLLQWLYDDLMQGATAVAGGDADSVEAGAVSPPAGALLPIKPEKARAPDSSPGEG